MMGTGLRSIFCAWMFLIALSACSQTDNSKPFTAYKPAKEYVLKNFRDSTETLLIADELNDEMGMNMAIIVDAVLQAGYMPDGFEQKQGYRIYRYKKTN